MLTSQCDKSWKKANEYQVLLHLHFVGFNVVFDSMKGTPSKGRHGLCI